MLLATRTRSPAIPLLVAAILCALLSCSARAQQQQQQQHRPMDVPDNTATSAPERTRLILKDGTYQLMLSYKVVGNVVRFRSAERNGEVEDIPLSLVDLPATERWKREHTPGAQSSAQQAPVLSPELAKEEAERAALTPEIAPDLRLPEEDSVLVLDTFRAAPELVPLAQPGSDLNKETAHGVLKGPVNPLSSPHRLVDIPRERADIQLHVSDPVFFVRIATPADNTAVDSGGPAFTVDTHGASGRATPSGGSADSIYVIERVDVRTDLRRVDSFRLGLLGSGRSQPDIIETRADLLSGGRWLKLSPLQPLEFGEYALIEVLDPGAVNLDVWDFGVHSDAPENAEAIHPEPQRPPTLERRRRY
ncbi:MAG TPA: hypothetical protein VHY48_01565 [Acidobacteriaceae bacterium]|jgi:hypothetical protein|nr:hypothetical protein [Acidobacteriaceae bacterium]